MTTYFVARGDPKRHLELEPAQADHLQRHLERWLPSFDRYRDYQFNRDRLLRLAPLIDAEIQSATEAVQDEVRQELRMRELPRWATTLLDQRKADSPHLVALGLLQRFVLDCLDSNSSASYVSD